MNPEAAHAGSRAVEPLPTDVTSGLEVHPARVCYPSVAPYDCGRVDVDGQSIYYEQSGNPHGKPVVFIHGGPGGGLGTGYRGFFDPVRYRIIGFDQRGCGNSTPHASQLTSPDQMRTNTTATLLDDMERIRTTLGIQRWMVFGGSWGSALGLAYAEALPERVSELVLRGIFTLRKLELDWYYNDGASYLFPERWELFLEPLRRARHHLGRDNIPAYFDLLWTQDPGVAEDAAVAWATWEAATSNLLHPAGHVAEQAEIRRALAFSRIENWYFLHHGWFAEGQLIAEASRLSNIPGVIVQGRYDMCCPVITSHDLHRAWPEADYRVVAAGHAAQEPNITSELVDATDRFATG